LSQEVLAQVAIASSTQGRSRWKTSLHWSKDILANPEVGDLVPGTGGLRKVRLGQRQVRRGKRGGLRVYYLDLAASRVTHLVAIFGKREKADLSPAERKAVGALVRRLKEEAS